MAAHDVALEFLRRTMSGQTHEELRQYITQALIDGDGAQSDGWQIRTAADALKPHPPLEYLVDQLLPAPSLCIVYGGPGSLKSMILADMAVCVAGGVRWLENLSGDNAQPGISFATTQSTTLWIDFDNGARRTDVRFGALLRAHNLSDSTPCHYVSMPTPHLDASKAVHVDALTALVRNGGYRLVVVDNLGLITGDTEENNADMANVMGHLRRLSEETQAAVVLIHHQRKSAAGSNGDGIRKGESLRGHSSIEAALDLALLIERKQGEDTIAIVPTKVRDFLPYDVIGARFTYEHIADSRELWAARFFSFATQSREDAAIQMLRTVIGEVVRIHPGIDQKSLVDEVRDRLAATSNAKPTGLNKVRGTIKQMADDGILRSAGTPKTGYQYWLS